MGKAEAKGTVGTYPGGFTSGSTLVVVPSDDEKRQLWSKDGPSLEGEPACRGSQSNVGS